jgi:hypothetical protein
MQTLLHVYHTTVRKQTVCASEALTSDECILGTIVSLPQSLVAESALIGWEASASCTVLIGDGIAQRQPKWQVFATLQ